MGIISSQGVLTPEILESAYNKVIDNSFTAPTLFISPKLMKDIIEWQKLEKYWKSLGPHKEKLERTKYRLRHRAKHIPVNLPD